MKRRSFFKRLAAVVAAVAIAPEIAFRTKLELPEVSDAPTSMEWRANMYFGDTLMVMAIKWESAQLAESITPPLSLAPKLTYSPSSTPRS